jgi:hypothetical protein
LKVTDEKSRIWVKTLGIRYRYTGFKGTKIWSLFRYSISINGLCSFQDLTHATEVHPSYLENSQLQDPVLHIQERTGEASLLPFSDPQGPAGKEDAVLFPDTSLRVQERSGEAVLLPVNGLQVPEGKEAALLFSDTGLRMQEEAVLLSDDVSLENQEIEAEAAPLGDETELVKSLAELDSHMEQVNTVPGNYTLKDSVTR